MAERLSESLVDEVLARTDILSVVGEHVKLTPKGGRHWGLCPFHGEKTPSFSVSSDKGLYYCFGCHEGGSAIQFLMKITGGTFQEVLRTLARRAGVTVPERYTQADQERDEGRELYYKIVELAGRYFEQQLETAQSAHAIEYLEERGVDNPTRRSFRLGYASESWDGLLRHLRRNKIEAREVERAGLAIARSGGGFYDRFRDRIVFPVIDRVGRIVGFSGRALGETTGAKYINSPELSYFKKGEHLFGIQAAKESLRKMGEAVVVEGNFDVVTLHAAGFTNTVAPLGTALTTTQVNLLSRMTQTVVLVFDGDAAGQKAMLRCLEPCYAVDLAVRAVVLPADEDPDSLVRRQGAKALHRLIDNAPSLMQLAIDQEIEKVVGGSPEQRLRVGRHLQSIFATIKDDALRQQYVEDSARRLEVSPGQLSASARAEPSDETSVGVLKLSKREILLIQLLADRPDLASQVLEQGQIRSEIQSEIAAFVTELASAATQTHRSLQRLVDGLSDNLRPVMLEAISSCRPYDSEQCEKQLNRLMWEFSYAYVSKQKKKIIGEMLAADRMGDEAQLLELAKRDRELTRRKEELRRHEPRLLH